MNRGQGQKKGTTRVLHYVFIQTQCVGEWKRTFYAVCVPMVWMVPSNHSTDCYFCIVPPIQNGMSMKKTSTLVYPHIPSAIRPVPHGDGLPVPEPLDNFAMYSDSVSSNSEEQQPSASRDVEYLPSTDSSNHKITEGELSDLIRELELQKIRQNFWHQGYNSLINSENFRIVFWEISKLQISENLYKLDGFV